MKRMCRVATSFVNDPGHLLGSLADFGLLPLPLAVALGPGAGVWFVMADRAGASRTTNGATFYALLRRPYSVTR